MAIVIEEEKKRINWFVLFVVLILVAGIASATYYLFFTPVPLIERVIPERLQSIKEVSTIEFRPDAVTGNPTFQILKQYINPIELASTTIERVNPFLPLK